MFGGQGFRQNINGEIVEVRYPVEIRKDKCFLCKQKGVFICEHNTSMRDMIHSTYLEEGRFYLDPRKSNIPKIKIPIDKEKFNKKEKNKVIPSDSVINENQIELPVSIENKIQVKDNKKKSACCTII